MLTSVVVKHGIYQTLVFAQGCPRLVAGCEYYDARRNTIDDLFECVSSLLIIPVVVIIVFPVEPLEINRITLLYVTLKVDVLILFAVLVPSLRPQMC